jgi:hypothetical protein
MTNEILFLCGILLIVFGSMLISIYPYYKWYRSQGYSVGKAIREIIKEIVEN